MFHVRCTPRVSFSRSWARMRFGSVGYPAVSPGISKSMIYFRPEKEQAFTESTTYTGDESQIVDTKKFIYGVEEKVLSKCVSPLSNRVNCWAATQFNNLRLFNLESNKWHPDEYQNPRPPDGKPRGELLACNSSLWLVGGRRTGASN